MTPLNGKPMFPCPICTQPREVRDTKKDKPKPYLHCDPCGVQLFVRGPAGIAELNRLLERTSNEGVVVRLKEMAQRYRLTCPDCGRQFWIEPELIETSIFDGGLKGFHVSAERLRCHRFMGAKAMKITVVGAALIIAAAVVVVLLIQALNRNQNGGPQQDQAV